MRKLIIFGLLLSLSLTVQANVDQASEEFGIASYYSDAFHGRKTASGQLYHKDKLTAAHKTLPFGTKIRVTRLDNKTSVTLTVNDRGPYIKGRIVDVSKAAAKRLDLITDGKARVKLEVLEKGDEDLVAAAVPVPDLSSLKSDEKKAATTIAKGKEENIPTEFNDGNIERLIPKTGTDKKETSKTNLKPKAKAPNLKVTKSPAKIEAKPKVAKETLTKKSPATKAVPAASSKAELVKTQDFKTYDLYKIQLMRPAKKGYGVQVASMSTYENVMKQVADLQGKWFNNILVSVEKGKDGGSLYKLILGPFPDRATADSYKLDLKKKKKINGFVVDLSALKY